MKKSQQSFQFLFSFISCSSDLMPTLLKFQCWRVYWTIVLGPWNQDIQTYSVYIIGEKGSTYLHWLWVRLQIALSKMRCRLTVKRLLSALIYQRCSVKWNWNTHTQYQFCWMTPSRHKRRRRRRRERRKNKFRNVRRANVYGIK